MLFAISRLLNQKFWHQTEPRGMYIIFVYLQIMVVRDNRA
jgi:hypothetical protein